MKMVHSFTDLAPQGLFRPMKSVIKEQGTAYPAWFCSTWSDMGRSAMEEETHNPKAGSPGEASSRRVSAGSPDWQVLALPIMEEGTQASHERGGTASMA